jgi:uncharacterized membrane protein YphA (DoxX/SURF4 family)
VHISTKVRSLPGRISTGAYILHSGLEKLQADDKRAAGVHGMASSAFPVLKQIPPPIFLRLLAASEVATGAALLAPTVPNEVAGAALAGFSGSLLAMYWRTPAMHKPDSVWPTPAGIAVSKDVWMLGIGLGLVLDGLATRVRRWRR